MLKLLLCAAVLSPCVIMQVAASVQVEEVEYDKPSFESYFIHPEFEQLVSCQTAELDIFFHDEYVTMHSAEYIAEAVILSKKCDDVEFTIQPIQPIYSTHDAMNAQEMTEIQVNELSLVLEAHGVDANIADTQVQSEFDNLSENGRTAVLKIATKTSKSRDAA